MELTTVWFVLIAVLWIGYFCLEGFDFGVGMLLPVLGRTETERRVLINTIGPVWDGNEVWLLIAGGATFAAFPEWYATLFSGFYLPLLLILVALIVRGLAFEYRAKRDDDTWRARWDLAIFWGSAVPALLWGVAFANIVRGVPIDADKEFTGNLLTLLNPYGLLGGVTTLLLFLTHGAMFTALKTDGEIRAPGPPAGLRGRPGAAVAAVGFLIWTQVMTGTGTSLVLFLLAALIAGRRAGGGAARPGGLGVPRHLPHHRAGGRRAVRGAVPGRDALHHRRGVLADHRQRVGDGVHADRDDLGGGGLHARSCWLYQGWTYWVFRKRISTHHIPAVVPETQPAA